MSVQPSFFLHGCQFVAAVPELAVVVTCVVESKHTCKGVSSSRPRERGEQYWVAITFFLGGGGGGCSVDFVLSPAKAVGNPGGDSTHDITVSLSGELTDLHVKQCQEVAVFTVQSLIGAVWFGRPLSCVDCIWCWQ